MNAALPATASAALPAGLTLNEYTLERVLGGGGFGITYLARDANLQLPVAIKEYFPSDLALRGGSHLVQVRGDVEGAQASFDWGLERFLDEARALASFRHPNIVRVLRYFRAHATAYIVMEYEQGESLKRWVPDHAPLSREKVLSLLAPLLDGLQAVHAMGFLHRDIKPDNICVRADGSPVLLDFGSARRVAGDHDLTLIVSPGFAAFEQYHSDGRQGPWTDLYSLGAVLYWMTTGRKPAEAAARVERDDMLPARSLADPAVFGPDLLEAIDWALHPDPAQRPQGVAEFRAALFGKPRPAAAPDAGPPSVPPGPTGPPQRRTLVCTLMALDLVGYANRALDEQVALRRLLGEVLARALRGIPEDSRLTTDTAGGAVTCFLGDPEEALHSALLLRDLLVQRYGQGLRLRIGLHMGPVRLLPDLQGRPQVIGDGLNVAQRVMDFAQSGQVLVSRAYHEVVSRLIDPKAFAFDDLGTYLDGHGREHQVLRVEPAGQRTHPQGPSTGYTQTSPLASRHPLDDAAVAEVEAELARHIGPLARVLVRKARPMAPSLARLREVLAPSIPDPRARESFVQPVTGPSQPISRSVPGASSQPTSPSQPAGERSLPKGAVAPEVLAALEAALTRQIGPMGRVLLRREAPRHGSARELAKALAATLERREQREAFLRDAKRCLGARESR